MIEAESDPNALHVLEVLRKQGTAVRAVFSKMRSSGTTFQAAAKAYKEKADLMFAIISTEQMEALGQVMVKQLKNRYNDPSKYKRFVVGIDRSKMKLYDVEESAQSDIVSDMSIPDKPIATWGDNERKDTFAEFKI